MRYFTFFLLLIFVVNGCSSSNVKYTKVDESYIEVPKPADAQILLTRDKIKRAQHLKNFCFLKEVILW